MHKPGKQPWRWLIILTTSLAIIFATIPASYKCLKCMNCGRRSLNDHEACCTWDKWPIQSHRPRSDYGNRPGVVKFVMIRNAHAENYEFVSFPEMRTSAITMLMVLEGIPHMAKLNSCPMHRIPNTLLAADFCCFECMVPGMSPGPLKTC